MKLAGKGLVSWHGKGLGVGREGDNELAGKGALSCQERVSGNAGKGLGIGRVGAERSSREGVQIRGLDGLVKWLEAGREGIRNRKGRDSKLPGKVLRCVIVKWL